MGSRLIASLMKQTRLAGSAEPDAVLVERFASHRDERAFAALVNRHGPMVWSVCRNALASEADAEDAFQATFLSFVRQVRSVRNPGVVGAWLHGTAVRVCLKARRANRRRLTRETQAACPVNAAAGGTEPWFDDVARVHRQIQLLPRREHEAFVLCVLEGVPQSEAARRLGVQLNSLSCLLARARQRLRARLKTDGAAVALAFTIAASAPAAVPAALAARSCHLATPACILSRSILSLTASLSEGTMRKALFATVVSAILGSAITLGTSLAGRAEAQQSPGNESVEKATVNGVYYDQSQQAGPRVRGEASTASPWEYKVVTRTLPGSIEPMLNELGNAGWELCSTNNVSNSNQMMFVFKRPKPARVVVGEKLDSSSEDQHRYSDPVGKYYGDLFEKTVEGQLRSGAQEPSTEVIQLKRTSATTVAKVLNEVFTGSTLATDSTSNSLVVRGSPEQLKRIKKLIELLESSGTMPGKTSR